MILTSMDALNMFVMYGCADAGGANCNGSMDGSGDASSSGDG
ncbi:MAG: hypothetical protein RMI32_02850 [Candidatus Nitrosocaldus sp.]|nr:hypothetical protein [Candidatus Nitrosocaldus sp.]